MADSLYELLVPALSHDTTAHTLSSSSRPRDFQPSPLVSNYLTHLNTVSLDDLSTTEPALLSQENHSTQLSLQSLSSRSHKNIINSTSYLKTFSENIPSLKQNSRNLQDAIPKLDGEALSFSTSYSRSNTENTVLDRRKKAMLLARNVDRLSDILELPSLLSTAIASAASSTGAISASGTANYSSALDLFAHIKRLQNLYPESPVVHSILTEAESAMKAMTTNLISSLRTQQNIRLAAAIRTIGWLRRVLPSLGRQTITPVSGPAPTAHHRSLSTLPLHSTSTPIASIDESSFGALFLVCRLANLLAMLEALSPLRDLAEQETTRRLSEPTRPKHRRSTASTISSPGQQTERYLKRYIEIFREHSFATISMFKNIFPRNNPAETSDTTKAPSDSLLEIPSAVSSFPLHLVELLMETLETYLPNVVDPQARESLLMQVLYAAGSLGRLGADFSMFIALLGDEGEAGGIDKPTDDGEARDMDTQAIDGEQNTNANEIPTNGQEKEGTSSEPNGKTDQIPATEADEIPEWMAVMQKHRVQASRLEALARSGSEKTGNSKPGHKGGEKT